MNDADIAYAAADSPTAQSLVDLLDRLLDTGAVVAGDLVVAVAGVDLLYLNLRLLVGSVESLRSLAESSTGGAAA